MSTESSVSDPLEAVSAAIDGELSGDLSPADGFDEAAADEMRTQRDDRLAVWASLEPDDAAVERFQWRIRGAVADAVSAEASRGRSERRRSRPILGRWRLSQIGSAAAACLVVGFFGGWLGHRALPPAKPGPSLAERPTSPGTIDFAGPGSAEATSAPIVVPVTNEYGQVVAFQRFGTRDEAQRFTEDLHRADSNSIDDRVRLMSAEKY